MAFNRSSAARSPARTSNQDVPNWQAHSFINFYLPRKGGGRGKLGSIPLRLNNEYEMGLAKFIEKNPEDALKALLNKVEVEFNINAPKEENAFDLG